MCVHRCDAGEPRERARARRGTRFETRFVPGQLRRPAPLALRRGRAERLCPRSPGRSPTIPRPPLPPPPRGPAPLPLRSRGRRSALGRRGRPFRGGRYLTGPFRVGGAWQALSGWAGPSAVGGAGEPQFGWCAGHAADARSPSGLPAPARRAGPGAGVWAGGVGGSRARVAAACGLRHGRQGVQQPHPEERPLDREQRGCRLLVAPRGLGEQGAGACGAGRTVDPAFPEAGALRGKWNWALGWKQLISNKADWQNP